MKRIRQFILFGIVAATLASCAKSGPITLSLATSQSRTGEVRMNTDASFQEPAALPVEVDYSVAYCRTWETGCSRGPLVDARSHLEN